MKTSHFIGVLLCSLAALSLSFCERIVYITDGTSSPEDGSLPAQPVYDTTVFVSGVEFPEDYDWKRDTAFGGVACKLVLFKNYKRHLEIPAGPSERVSGEPDMHHLVEGELFTEYSSDTETFITRGGKELLRFKGREFLCGIIADGNDVWTLGQDRDGKGFTYRKNGEQVLRSDSGVVLGRLDSPLLPTGALYEDGGKHCFSWKTETTVGVAKKAQWHVYRGGEVTDLPYNPDILDMYDIRVAGGEVCMVFRTRNAFPGLKLCIGEKEFFPGERTLFTPLGCRIVPHEDGLVVTGAVSTDKGGRAACIWDTGDLRMETSGNMVIFSFTKKGIASVSCDEGGDVNFVRGLSRQWNPGKNVRIMTPYCLSTAGESAFAALTPLRGKPVVFTEEKNLELDINGFLTSVYAVITERE